MILQIFIVQIYENSERSNLVAERSLFLRYSFFSTVKCRKTERAIYSYLDMREIFV